MAAHEIVACGSPALMTLLPSVVEGSCGIVRLQRLGIRNDECKELGGE
jgi:hypothetical protein